MYSIVSVCLQTDISQTLLVYNSRILRIKNVKFSEQYFYMSKNIQGDFQICVSVPLIKKAALAQVVCYEFCEISKNTFSTDHLWTTASVNTKLETLLQHFVTSSNNKSSKYINNLAFGSKFCFDIFTIYIRNKFTGSDFQKQSS